MTAEIKEAHAKLKAFALSLPGAFEDFPWGESVIKVNKKIFVFYGMADDPHDQLYLGVKLPRTGEYALGMPFVKPSGYNLGKYGWVSINLSPDDDIPMDLFIEWIEESYRAIAPKKLIAQLDADRTANDLIS
ncbi:MAG: MmcQ/YjbR family DNA-binding protein [Chloroflexia bacterium]